jgi:hypothetical protein
VTTAAPKSERSFPARVHRVTSVRERSTRAFAVIMTPCPWSTTAGPRHLYQRAAHTFPAREKTDYASPSPPRDCSRVPINSLSDRLACKGLQVPAVLLFSSDKKRCRIAPVLLGLVRRASSSLTLSHQTLCQVALTARPLARRLRTFTRRSLPHVSIHGCILRDRLASSPHRKFDPAARLLSLHLFRDKMTVCRSENEMQAQVRTGA